MHVNHKISPYSDTRKIAVIVLKFEQHDYHRVMQTVSILSSQIWVYTVCSGLSIRKLIIVTVFPRIKFSPDISFLAILFSSNGTTTVIITILFG